MRVAAIQFRPPKGQPTRARADLVDLIDRAGSAGVDLVVCPEMATTGYLWEGPEELAPFAESPRGPTYEALARAADQHKCWIVCGFPESAPDGLYNSALVVRPDGGLAGCYRKVLLYEADETWARPGQERFAVSTRWGRVMPAICMDLNDPEIGADLIRLDSDVLAFCTNWVDEGIDVMAYWQWRVLGWDGWFVAANSWGEDGAIRFTGGSAIFGPGGEVLTRAGREGNAVLMAELPLPRK